MLQSSIRDRIQSVTLAQLLRVLIAALISGIAVHAGLYYPIMYFHRGGPMQCSDVKPGTSFEEVRRLLRSKSPPAEEFYTGERLQWWTVQDGCVVYFDQNTNRVKNVERSSPPLVE
jgi:hypothetical protein